jgi:hypothetical protein
VVVVAPTVVVVVPVVGVGVVVVVSIDADVVGAMPGVIVDGVVVGATNPTSTVVGEDTVAVSLHPAAIAASNRATPGTRARSENLIHQGYGQIPFMRHRFAAITVDP